MRRCVLALSIVIGTAVVAVPAHAQGFPREVTRDLKEILKDVPKAQLPPPGMCRIWLNGVPAGQQPAPTDCATAVRNRPANARVIFNDEKKDDGKAAPKKDDDKDDKKRPKKP